MKIFGVDRKQIKTNRFITLVFSDGTEHFVQKRKNDFQYFFMKVNLNRKELEDIKQLKINKSFEKNYDQCIFGFVDNSKRIKCGTSEDLFDFFYKKIDEVNDRIVKIKIAETIFLNGFSTKLRLERDEYYNSRGIQITFRDSRKFLPIDSIKKTPNVFESYLKKYRNHLDKYADLKWEYIVYTNPFDESDDFYLDKFRFRLAEVFSYLVDNQMEMELSKELITKHNSIVSYNVETSERKNENNEDNLDAKVLEKIKSISSFVKENNNE